MCSAFCLSRKGSLLLCLYLVLIILAHNRRLNPDQWGCKKWCREAAGRRKNTRKSIVNVGSVGYHPPTLILVEKLQAKQQILQPLVKLVTECNTHSNHGQGRAFCKDWTVWVQFCWVLTGLCRFSGRVQQDSKTMGNLVLYLHTARHALSWASISNFFQNRTFPLTSPQISKGPSAGVSRWGC